MSAKPFSISAKMLISDSENRWLLIRRSDTSGWNPGAWDLPGGKLNPGEMFMDGLIREISEETGLSVIIDSLFGSIEDETDDFRIVHLVMNGNHVSGDVKLSREHMDYIWVEQENALELDLCDFVRNLIESKLNQNL